MRSWKTTLGGSLAASGAFLFTVPVMLHQYTEIKIPYEVGKWSVIVGIVLTVLGTLATGLFGRDNDKTSADVGAVTTPKPPPQEPQQPPTPPTQPTP